MKESFSNASEELKRIDHLVYVTLKYTRTVDVLISVLRRMISTYDHACETLLKIAKAQGKIDEVPEMPLLKAHKVRELYPQKIVQENIKTYLLIRKLVKAPHTKKNEYRRHVTMTAEVDEETININIDKITEMFDSIKKFIGFVFRLVKEND